MWKQSTGAPSLRRWREDGSGTDRPPPVRPLGDLRSSSLKSESRVRPREVDGSECRVTGAKSQGNHLRPVVRLVYPVLGPVAPTADSQIWSLESGSIPSSWSLRDPILHGSPSSTTHSCQPLFFAEGWRDVEGVIYRTLSPIYKGVGVTGVQPVRQSAEVFGVWGTVLLRCLSLWVKG